VHERYRRQTDGPSTAYSERERQFTFAKNGSPYIISDRCLSRPVLSVTLVYCGQTVGQIKMKLGVQVSLGPGHMVLRGDPGQVPSPKGHSPLILGPYLL